MLARLASRLTYANVMATVAVFLALGGGAYAALELPKNSVGTKQLKNHAVTPKKVSPKAVKLFNADKRRYLHYLIDEIPPYLGSLDPEDFHLPRLRYIEPGPYSEAEFRRTYEWMLSYPGLITPGATYETAVDNRAWV